MKAYFVSDIHLTSMKDLKAGILLRFLQTLPPDTTHLFFLGDIFDLWLANHKIFIERYHPLVQAVSILVQKGIEVHFFEGNHDFHLKEFWQDQVGVRIHEGPRILNLGPWTARVEHGDETNPDDKNYLKMRAALRSPFMKFLAFNLPQKILVFIGENWSSTSKKTSVYVNEKVKQRARRFAEERAREQQFDYMICGHIHMRDHHEITSDQKKSKYINLGTWLERPSALELTDNGERFIELT